MLKFFTKKIYKSQLSKMEYLIENFKKYPMIYRSSDKTVGVSKVGISIKLNQVFKKINQLQ